MEYLCDQELSASQIAEPLPISLVTVLLHLQALKKGGLIHTQKPAGCARVASSPNTPLNSAV